MAYLYNVFHSYYLFIIAANFRCLHFCDDVTGGHVEPQPTLRGEFGADVPIHNRAKPDNHPTPSAGDRLQLRHRFTQPQFEPDNGRRLPERPLARHRDSEPHLPLPARQSLQEERPHLSRVGGN